MGRRADWRPAPRRRTSEGMLYLVADAAALLAIAFGVFRLARLSR
jgi:hypothetical protein